MTASRAIDPTSCSPCARGRARCSRALCAPGTLDLALLAGVSAHIPPDDREPALEVETLAEGPLRVAVGASHRLAGRSRVSVAELAGERWAAARSEGQEWLLGVWPGSAGRADVAYVVRDWLTKLRLVASGAAITTVSDVLLPALPPDVRAVSVRDDSVERAAASARSHARRREARVRHCRNGAPRRRGDTVSGATVLEERTRRNPNRRHVTRIAPLACLKHVAAGFSHGRNETTATPRREERSRAIARRSRRSRRAVGSGFRASSHRTSGSTVAGMGRQDPLGERWRRSGALGQAPGSVFGEDLDVASVARAAADTDTRPADHEVGVHRAYVDPAG